MTDVHNEDGSLNLKLTRKNFEKGVDGTKEFCDYMIAKWTLKKNNAGLKRALSPEEKIQKKIARLQKQMAELKADN